MRVLAVDWSGDAHLAARRIWLAEADAPGRLVRLEAGRDRAAIADHLTAQAGQVTIGLDFAFSFPAWFVHRLGLASAPDLWAHVAESGEGWLAACEPPFWGRPGRRRPDESGGLYRRRTEQALAPVSGIRPKSVFQIGGAGAVGTGSIRGMPLLHQLFRAGASIWPFVEGSWPAVVEIYPRLLTRAVRKSNADERRGYLEARYPRLDPEHLRLGTLSEDAFDAAVSALVMVEHLDDLQALPIELDPVLRLEGRIWHPGWRRDRL